MKTSHKFGIAAVAAVAALGFSAPVQAGDQPIVTADMYCDGETGIELEISDTDGDMFSVFIDDLITPVESDVEPGYDVFDTDGNGFYRVVVVDQATDQVVFDKLIGVACEGPQVRLDTSCEDDGGHLWINLADRRSYDYNITIDGVPAAEWEPGDSDTDQDFFDLGVFAEGTHTVLVQWILPGDGAPTETGSNTQTVVIDCDADSGAGIPTVGSSSTPLLAIAGLLMAGGIGLLAARRLRTA